MNIDKELRDQQAFEEAPFSREDKKLYSLLMNELSQESGVDIQPSFSVNVIRKLEAKKKKEARWEFLLFTSAILGVIILTVLAFSFVTSSMADSLNILQSGPITPVLLLTTFIIVFQVLDKKYIKDTRLKKRLKET